MTSPCFSPKAMTFLRALKRNNDREWIATSKASMYRIYRDTRFSDNKAPLKTHVAAVFPPRGLPKHQGAGLYFHIALDGVWVGGGMYAPDTSQLPGIVSVFRQIAPLVAFLNEPLLKDGLSRSA